MESPRVRTGHTILDLLAWPVWAFVWAISQWGLNAASVAADLAVAVGALAGAAVTLLRLYRMITDSEQTEVEA